MPCSNRHPCEQPGETPPRPIAPTRHQVVWPLLAACCIWGCSPNATRIGSTWSNDRANPDLTPDAATADAATEPDGRADAGTLPGEPVAARCAPTSLGTSVGQLVDATAQHAPLTVEASDCASPLGAIQYTWEAPSDGCFQVTAGSGPGINMVRAFSETCDGPLLDCVEHAIAGGILHLKLVAGERIIIATQVTDGDEDGSHFVEIEAQRCD